MSCCTILNCSLCDKEVHHGGCYVQSPEALIPFVIKGVYHYICGACESRSVADLFIKFPNKGKNEFCFFCDLCNQHREIGNTSVYLQWGHWGMDTCSECLGTTTFRGFMDSRKCQQAGSCQAR